MYISKIEIRNYRIFKNDKAYEIKDINEIGEFVCLQMEKKKLLNT